MTSKSKSKTESRSTEKPIGPDSWEVVYLDESVRNFEFSDVVQIKSYQRGMLLSFAKIHLTTQKRVIFKEILVPFDVTISLINLMKKQIDQLVEKGLIEIEQEENK